MSEDKKNAIRGKITLEFRENEAIPEVKFFGDITPRDMNMVKMRVQQAWRIYMFKAGQKEIAKHKKEEAIEAESKANKELENGSTTDRPTKEESGSIETGSTGSGADSEPGSEGTVLTDQGGSPSDDGGTDDSLQQETGGDAEVLPEGTKDSTGVGGKGRGSVQPRKRTTTDT